jgi:hypothetical protein
LTDLYDCVTLKRMWLRPDRIYVAAYPDWPEVIHCDFCGSTDIHKSYAAYDFAIEKHPGGGGRNSESGWAACKRCAHLIDNEYWHRLEDRSVELYFRGHPELHNDPVLMSKVRLEIRDLHKLFREHRIMES